MSDAPNPADTFRQEAQDLLEQLEQSLLDLEDNPGDQALIDQVFRALHTIKGSGAMFGFDALAAFTHHLETAFDKVRSGKVQLNAALVGVTLAAKDHIRALIERPDEADEAIGTDLLTQLSGLMAGETDAPLLSQQNPVPVPNVVVEGPATYHLRFRLPSNAMAMGTNPLYLLDELRTLGDCTVTALTDDIPCLEALDPSVCYVTWDVVLSTSRAVSAIDEVFLFVRDDMELTIEKLPSEPKRLGEILCDRGDVAPAIIADAAASQEKLGSILVKTGAVSESRLRSALAEQNHLSDQPVAAKQTDSIRVPAERLDGLLDQVGELVIAQARLKQIAQTSFDPQIKAVAEEIERLTSGLRDTSMGIRMVPIGSLFGRFRRLVHDLAQTCGKPVRLTTSGGETELDKTVIERLADPLVHLIRNCVDHGLENVDGRQAAGKAPEGEVHLSAQHSGAQVLITIRDDGRGLDRIRIRSRAEEQGLLTTSAKLTDNELFQCIFLPGFSTAAQVTSLSGRGVGMDVVKRTIDSLRGSIDISSEPGQGTQVVLRLPLTLAIIDGLLVRVGRGHYVVPLSAVEECVELSAIESARSTGRNFLSIRGSLVPFLRLRELFGVSVPTEPYQKVIIVSSGDLRVGLVVDQVIGEHQTVIKSLSKLHADVQSFSGATILGDGSVALILDVAHLIEEGQQLEETLKAS
jgi:two-component system chemotaxis sensor kinase CheA